MASFEERILAMERELRDLKTAHNRGLGVVTFYKQATLVPFSTHIYWRLKATGNNSKLFPFIAQIAVSNTSMHTLTTEPVEVDSESNSITWHYYPTDTSIPEKISLKVVSTDNLHLDADYE